MSNFGLLRQISPIVNHLDRLIQVYYSEFDDQVEYSIVKTANAFKDRGDPRDINLITNNCVQGWVTERGIYTGLNTNSYNDFAPDNRVWVHLSPQDSNGTRRWDLAVIQELDFDDFNVKVPVYRIEVKFANKYQLGRQFCFNDKKDSGYNGINVEYFLDSPDTNLLVLASYEQNEKGWLVKPEGIIHRDAFSKLEYKESIYNDKPRFYFWWDTLIENNLAIRLNKNASTLDSTSEHEEL